VTGVTELLTHVARLITHGAMIRSFRHKGLKELFEKGASAGVQKALQDRCQRRLDALDRAARAKDMNFRASIFTRCTGSRSVIRCT
jgi:hypothetical protein